MKVLVTGATGLLGSHLLVRLTGEQFKGLEVIGLRRKNSNMEAVKEVFSYYGHGWEEKFESIKWRIGDVLDKPSIEKALNDIDLVYHCAAIVSFDPKDRRRLIESNIEGTKNIVSTLLEFNNTIKQLNTSTFKQLVHVSSTSALGDSPGNDPTFLVDEQTPRDPNRTHSGYSVSKYESEKIVWNAIDQGLDAMIVNPGIILGPGFWDKGSSKLFTQMKEGLRFFTKGGTGYIDVRDVASLLVEMLKGYRVERLKESRVPSPESRYCLVGSNMYFEDFFNLVADELGVKRPSIKAGWFLSGLAWRIGTLKARLTGGFPLITRETAESANRISFYSSKKAKTEYGFEYREIEDTIKWVCKHIRKNSKPIKNKQLNT